MVDNVRVVRYPPGSSVCARNVEGDDHDFVIWEVGAFAALLCNGDQRAVEAVVASALNAPAADGVCSVPCSEGRTGPVIFQHPMWHGWALAHWEGVVSLRTVETYLKELNGQHGIAKLKRLHEESVSQLTALCEVGGEVSRPQQLAGAAATAKSLHKRMYILARVTSIAARFLSYLLNHDPLRSASDMRLWLDDESEARKLLLRLRRGGSFDGTVMCSYPFANTESDERVLLGPPTPNDVAALSATATSSIEHIAEQVNALQERYNEVDRGCCSNVSDEVVVKKLLSTVRAECMAETLARCDAHCRAHDEIGACEVVSHALAGRYDGHIVSVHRWMVRQKGGGHVEGTVGIVACSLRDTPQFTTESGPDAVISEQNVCAA